MILPLTIKAGLRVLHDQYYYIDYGISVHFPTTTEPKLIVGDDGRDQEVPELSETVPYDPFEVDVFIIGNLLRRYFYDVFSNVDFLVPLFTSMVKQNPSERPSAAEALEQWKSIRDTVPLYKRSWAVRGRETLFVYKATLTHYLSDVPASI